MAKITFLGTGASQGVPIIGCNCEVCTSTDPRDKRLRSSILVEESGVRILIDAGPDFRTQLLREGVDDLDAVLLTHQHKDHTGGLDDLRAINYIQNKSIPIYCEERVKFSLQKEYYYAFESNPYPGAPKFDIKVIDRSPFSIKGVEIIPIRAFHYKLPIFGYRIGHLTYITDANRIEQQELEKVKGSKIFIINSLRREPHISHFSLSEAIVIAKSLNIEKSYLTHLSHQIGSHHSLSKELPKGIELAYDMLKIEL